MAPIGKAFDPELVLVSSGFDAHRGDPLAPMALTSAGFAHLMAVCLGVAGGTAGEVVVALEGGYLLDGIASAGAAVVSALLGA